MTAAYLEVVAPLRWAVPCGGQDHHLRWQAGQLVTEAHDDPDGERVLAALGGEVPACVQVLDAWSAWSTRLRALTLLSRGPSDPLRLEEEEVGTGATGWYSSGGGFNSSLSIVPMHAYPGRKRRRGASAQPEVRDEVADLVLLLRQPGLGHRLSATVASHWADRLAERTAPPAAQPELVAALTGRVVPAVRSWLGDPARPVEVRMVEPEVPPELVRADGGIEVSLPFAWLVSVWAPGLALTAGRLALSVVRTGDGLDLDLLSPAGERGLARLSLP